eukprot:SAG11_NODE_1207_length_5524_cov_2.959447_6_plen_254_part_00
MHKTTRQALAPYLALTLTVRNGELGAFKEVAQLSLLSSHSSHSSLSLPFNCSVCLSLFCPFCLFSLFCFSLVSICLYLSVSLYLPLFYRLSLSSLFCRPLALIRSALCSQVVEANLALFTRDQLLTLINRCPPARPRAPRWLRHAGGWFCRCCRLVGRWVLLAALRGGSERSALPCLGEGSRPGRSCWGRAAPARQRGLARLTHSSGRCCARARRLRHNVIKTGLRNINTSYSKISVRTALPRQLVYGFSYQS